MTDRPDRDRRTDAERRMQEALGPDLASDAVGAAGAVTQPATSIRNPLIAVILAIVVLTVISFIVAPPLGVNAAGHSDPAVPFSYPADAIKANFELPRPHDVIDLDANHDAGAGIVTWDLTIPSTLLTGWIVMAVIIVVAFVLSRSIRLSPTGRQNALEYAYEGLANFAISLGGPAARRYIPIFVGVLPVHPVEQLERAPAGRRQDRAAPGADERREHHDRAGPRQLRLSSTSRASAHLGVRGYLGKFFPFYEFKDGIGGRGHRPVRRPDRAHARVRQAGHAVDAALRQHLRRRGRARRHHRPDHRASSRSRCSASSSCSTRSRP